MGLPPFRQEWRIPELPAILLGTLAPHEFELLALVAACQANDLERPDLGGIEWSWFARHLGKDARQVRRTMQNLISKGYIKVSRRQSKPNRYEILWPWEGKD